MKKSVKYLTLDIDTKGRIMFIDKKDIKSIRYGLATNSSSTHSIIHNAQLARAKTIDDRVWDSEFGWDFFTAGTKEAKSNYMLQQLKYNIPRVSLEAMKFIGEKKGFSDKIEDIVDGYIDHQSVISFPTYKGSDTIHMKFFEDYYNYIVDGDFVILGGNDNDEDSHPLSSEGDGTESYFWELTSQDKAYYNGNYWVIIGPKRKLRLQLGGESLPLQPEKPELVDLKITDYCDMGCPYCYQGSTEEGKHADRKYIRDLFSEWDDHIYEIAIGGGEPTSHPDFADIVSMLNRSGYIVNFTTKSITWMNNKGTIDAVKESVSGIAYSPSNIPDARKFIEAHDEFVGDSCELYLHIIPELMGEERFAEFVSFVDEENKDRWRNRIHLTLLGYKTTGRGSSFDVGHMDKLIEIAMSPKRTPVGIDTKIASDYEDDLREKNVSKKLYTTTEGEFSMYVDAVEKKASKSSYETENAISTIKSTNRFGDTLYEMRDIFKNIVRS